MCQCDACLRVGSARTDPDFLAMQAAAGLAAALAGGGLPGEEGEVGGGGAVHSWEQPAAGAAARTSGGGSSSSRGGRRLQQSGDAMLSAVLSAVGTLQDSQAALEQQVAALQAAVEDSAAAARDASVAALIASGQQQIAAGQAAIQGMLGEILGKQTAAAAAAAAQMQALANLQSLQQQQLATQAALDQSAKDQTDAIAIALQQDMLTSRCGLGEAEVKSGADVACTVWAGQTDCPGCAPPSTLPLCPQPGTGALPARAPADAGGHQGLAAGLAALHRRHARGARL